eukprot:8952779-Alexandrium_andersonii.AAC.1
MEESAPGLRVHELARMKSWGLPVKFICRLMLYFHTIGLDMTRDSDGAEIFAGVKTLSANFKAKGFKNWNTFDYEDDNK